MIKIYTFKSEYQYWKVFYFTITDVDEYDLEINIEILL